MRHEGTTHPEHTAQPRDPLTQDPHQLLAVRRAGSTQPGAQAGVVHRHRGRGERHRGDSAVRGLGQHPAQERVEDAFVAGGHGDLPVPEGFHALQQVVPSHSAVPVVEVVAEHQLCALREAGLERLPRAAQQQLQLLQGGGVVREDHVLLAAVLAEERGPADARRLGKLLHGGLRVPVIRQHADGARDHIHPRSVRLAHLGLLGSTMGLLARD